MTGTPAGVSRPRLRLSRLLLYLVLAVLLPALGIGGAAIWYLMSNAQAAAQARLSDTVQALALVVDREITGHMAALKVLAASTALSANPASPDLAAFYTQAQLAAAQLDSPVSLFRRDGTQILNTQRPLGTLLPTALWPDLINQVFDTGQPVVGYAARSSLTGRWAAGAYVPVLDGSGHVALVLVRAWDVEKLRALFIAQGLPHDSFAGVVDSRNRVVARSDALHDQVVGQPAPPENAARYQAFEAGLTEAVGLDGRSRVFAFRHVASAPGWTVVVAQPAADLEAAWRQPLLAFSLGGAGALALGLWLAYVVGQRILIPLQRLSLHAHFIAMSNGESLASCDSADGSPAVSIAELETLRRGFAAAKDALQRRAEAAQASAAALAQSEARFRMLADVMPQLVWAAWPDGRCDYFNARCYAFTGAAVGSLDDEAWKALVHPDDRPVLEANWRQAIQTSAPIEFECRRQRHDGAYRWMLVRGMPMLGEPDERHPRGPILRWFGSSTDISDIVEARELSARGHAELAALVDARTAELSEMQTRLAHAARMDALGQLAGGIAHDFNNVLQAILGGSALIERKPNDPATIKRYARMIFDSAERGSAITQRLLGFSRRSTLHKEVIDPAGILRDIQEILSHTMGGGIETEIRAQPDLPPLVADKGQLETVLVNLATNARDAMDGKGVILLTATVDLVEATNTKHPAALMAGSYICLSVTDTGIGMDAATLSRVFEPFFTTKQPGQGTGLGLAMAHGFAGQSSGGLHIESTPGQGTTIKLWLPAHKSTAPKRADRTVLPATCQHRGRLLLVDDEASIRDLLGDALAAEGFVVAVAASADEAMSILDEGTVDLLISDLSMPGTDGLALIKEAQRRKSGLPAILTTGFARDETEVAMTGAFSGSFSLLRKPIIPMQLVTRISELLGNGRG